MNKDNLQIIIDHLKDPNLENVREVSGVVWMLPDIFPDKVTRNIHNCEHQAKYGECYCELCMDHPMSYKGESMQYQYILSEILNISYNQADMISDYQMMSHDVRGTIKSSVWRFSDLKRRMVEDIPPLFRTYNTSTAEDVIHMLEWFRDDGNEYWNSKNK